MVCGNLLYNTSVECMYICDISNQVVGLCMHGTCVYNVALTGNTDCATKIVLVFFPEMS